MITIQQVLSQTRNDTAVWVNAGNPDIIHGAKSLFRVRVQ